jgi:hypothetical protein
MRWPQGDVGLGRVSAVLPVKLAYRRIKCGVRIFAVIAMHEFSHGVQLKAERIVRQAIIKHHVLPMSLVLSGKEYHYSVLALAPRLKGFMAMRRLPSAGKLLILLTRRDV